MSLFCDLVKVLAFLISMVNFFVHNLKCLIYSNQKFHLKISSFLSFSCFSKLFFLMQIVRTLCLFLTPSERKCSRLCRNESSFKYESGLFVQGLLKVSKLRVVLFFCSVGTFFDVCMRVHIWHYHFPCKYLHVKIPSQSFL